MTTRFSVSALLCALITGVVLTVPAAAQDAPLAMTAARVSIAGTSNIHEYTASTTDVKLTNLALAEGIAGRLSAPA